MRWVLLIWLWVVSSSILAQPSDEIDSLLNGWHRAAAEADLHVYFDLIAEDGYFLGTDESEIWNKSTFYEFSKPYFEKKETWDFKVKSRNVFFSKARNVAWFEEVLDTWMGPCRGSGVLEREEGEWKLKQYNLSVLVSNDVIQDYLKILEHNEGTDE